MINWTKAQDELWCIRALNAIEKLKNFYRGFAPNVRDESLYISTSYGSKIRGGCPLCLYFDSDRSGIENCGRCPWMVLDGTQCYRQRQQHYSDDTMKERFSRLNRWETSILRRLEEVQWDH